MNILVTGGAGYIGKVFINKYNKKFDKIYVIDNLFDSYNRNFPDNVIFYEYNALNFSFLGIGEFL